LAVLFLGFTSASEAGAFAGGALAGAGLRDLARFGVLAGGSGASGPGLASPLPSARSPPAPDTHQSVAGLRWRKVRLSMAAPTSRLSTAWLALLAAGAGLAWGRLLATTLRADVCRLPVKDTGRGARAVT